MLKALIFNLINMRAFLFHEATLFIPPVWLVFIRKLTDTQLQP